ncbi:hypothetical protein [Aeromonas sp.]|jgi:hypothetical protein|uniref:hypothetical protein n=1 Tax=Aeromonas sp. TaxID=647 RepID=UPI00258846B0|nr:hypothetical protein [Aeromonas sp.]MCX7134003.1 hypothetical protein [Aeromonas sp.]
MKATKWSVGLCALLAGVIGWCLWPQPVAPGLVTEEGEAPAADPGTLVELTPLAAMPAPVLKPAPVTAPVKPDRLREDGSQQLETPWQAAEVDADFPLAEPGEGAEQPQPIALQGGELGLAQVGDSVTLPLPDGSTLEARVTKVELQRGGERNWQGEIRVDGDSYPVNFTVGKQATFGFIGTPQGSYSVETLGGKGWVYKNPPLDRGHGGSDALIPTHQ